ncbi:MAG: T9SS type A sorting domain-containing protein [Flavobacteriales bacterium]
MKYVTLSIALLFGTLSFAQTEVTVNTAAANADQVYYSLLNGVVATAPLAEWDLAFEITGFTSSILVNTAKGHLVYQTDAAITDWASVNVPDEASWIALNNSETNWSEGALTYGSTVDEEGFDLGWGTYNMVTHVVAGTRIYAIQMVDGGWKKLRINGLSGGVYSFTYADLDGSNEQNASLVKADFTGKNFGYWDMSSHQAVDHEPMAAEWDLVFTKYLSYIPAGDAWYAVAGVLANMPVECAQLDGVDPITVEHGAAEGQYGTDINVIGSDWKVFNMTTFMYEYVTDRAYFVKDVAGNLWKLVFTGYGGSATGTMTFTQQLMSATAVAEVDLGSAMIFPNPAIGQAHVVLDLPVQDAVVSILALNGQELRTQRLNGITRSTVHSIDLAGIPSGMYMLRVAHAEGVIGSRLIVQ